jgi:3-oxoacyl-[acyl-carrier-protein] synthase II
MLAALRTGGRSPGEVDYINAHAAGTPAGDAAEVTALRQVFGGDLPPVSSTKSMHGHLIGAAGAAEAAATVLALATGVLPPTINHVHTDPRCDIDIVANEARPQTVHTALSNSFGLGGVNSCLLFGRPPERDPQ